MLALYLVAFLFFNEGIQTVINQSPVFAEEVVGFTPDELALLVLVFQFICFPGAMLIGRLADPRLSERNASASPQISARLIPRDTAFPGSR